MRLKRGLKNILPDLSVRSDEKELMDSPDCDAYRLINTVRQFEFINVFFTASRRLIKMHILGEMLKVPGRTYTLLDVGAGGCDIPLWIVKYCRKHHLKIKITCLDNDRRIIDYARRKCAPVPEIEIVKSSVFEYSDSVPFDFVFANHFLHHLNDSEILKLLNFLPGVTDKVFLLNDLKRSLPAYLGYTLFTGLFFHKSFAFYDGRLSIRRGFKQKELQELIEKVPGENIQIIKAAPARLALLGCK